MKLSYLIIAQGRLALCTVLCSVCAVLPAYIPLLSASMVQVAGLPVQYTQQLLPRLSFCCAVLRCAESLFCVQVAGLQVVVDQGAIDRAVPLLPGTRMTLPLMLHCPQVSRHPLCLDSCAQRPRQALQPLSAMLSVARNSPTHVLISTPTSHISASVHHTSMHSAPHSGCVRDVKDS